MKLINATKIEKEKVDSDKIGSDYEESGGG